MKFSIITINYNNAEGLERTIQSIASQDYMDYEYIVIDGGSTDGSVDVIQKYADNISYWVSEPDRGIYNAMNKGIAHANGEYLNFMNSGDCLHDSMVLSRLKGRDINSDIIVGGYYNPDTKEIKTYSHIESVTCLTLLKDTFNHQATFYRRSLFDNRQYDETYRIQSDFKFNFECIVYGNCSVSLIDDVIADYDWGGISGTNIELVQRERSRVMNELLPHRILADYESLFTPAELPIVSLLPQLRRTGRLQYFVYIFAIMLLWLHKKCSH